MLLSAQDTHFWHRQTIQAHELNTCLFIMRQRDSQTRIWLDETLARQSIQPQVMAEFDNLESIKRSVMAGQAMTILPQYAVQDEQQLGRLRTIAIEQRPFVRTLKLIWSKREHFSTRFLSLTSSFGTALPENSGCS